MSHFSIKGGEIDGREIRKEMDSLPDGQYLFTIEELPPSKTPQQMAYYRDTILKAFGRTYGERDLNACHEIIKSWLGVGSFADLNKPDFSDIIQKVTDKILELGGEIPHPERER